MTDTTPRDSDPQTYAILGAAMDVHSELGCGFVEQVYQDALVLEFADHDIPFEREVILRVAFKRRILPSFYRPDFICFGHVIVEVKAEKQLMPLDLAQMINYLKVAGVERGLVINFGGRKLEWRRVICSERVTNISEDVRG